MIELVGRRRFEAGQNREHFLQLVKSLPFGGILSMLPDYGIDLALSALLPRRERIQFRLGHNHFLVRPAHRNELAHERHLQFALHFLAAVLASETSDETSRPSARLPTAVMNIRARCVQNIPRISRT